MGWLFFLSDRFELHCYCFDLVWSWSESITHSFIFDSSGDCFGHGSLLWGRGKVDPGKNNLVYMLYAVYVYLRLRYFDDDWFCMTSNIEILSPCRTLLRSSLKLWVQFLPALIWIQWNICEFKKELQKKFFFVEKWNCFFHKPEFLLQSVVSSGSTSWLWADLKRQWEWVRVLIPPRASNEPNLDTTEYKCGPDVDDQIWCKCRRGNMGLQATY